MAILENKTKNYFKVNLARSFVHNNMLFASMIIYGTESDRQNEKNRLAAFKEFDAYCKSILKDLSADEKNAELYSSFSLAVRFINRNRYTSSGETFPETTFSQEVTQLLTKCGYRPDWITRPIYVVCERLVNCGMHNGETLTAEYIYSKLKTNMTLDKQDI